MHVLQPFPVGEPRCSLRIERIGRNIGGLARKLVLLRPYPTGTVFGAVQIQPGAVLASF